MAPNEHEFHESEIEIPGPRGCYVLKPRASARWARVEPVSCCSPCSWAMVHRVTVQPLTKNARFPGDPRRLSINFCPLSPGPFPPRALGKGTFFCRMLQAGYARLQHPNFFSSSPTASAPLGRRQGVGQKLQVTKVHPSPSSYLAPGQTVTAHFHFWIMYASTWRLFQIAALELYRINPESQ